ncbi:MAG: hypothetical protein EZS28_007470 [Streblomastix strix]|uniref:Uncharacterized protein n=1 Tax=Streblomastix strix TaxID=222440 RepID=A0A5J4WQI4_9EUKA|nr:MAG: hypothetical protein EZS28_007470 [Streblomastix strix]
MRAATQHQQGIDHVVMIDALFEELLEIQGGLGGFEGRGEIERQASQQMVANENASQKGKKWKKQGQDQQKGEQIQQDRQDGNKLPLDYEDNEEEYKDID